MLYRVNLPNDYFDVGTIVEDGDDGMVQAVDWTTVNGRIKVGGFYGMLVPLIKVRPYLMALLQKGFDDVGAFATYRRAH